MHCYHTCKTDGGREYVSNVGPFLSGENEPGRWQWLTQGYYFWTDDPYFAHIWGRASYKNNYAILKCTLSFQSDMLLDLAGNVSHSIYFNNLIQLYVKKLKRTNPNVVPTVSTVIEHFRNEEKKQPSIFPYQAIKAGDVPGKKTDRRKKIQYTPANDECLPLIPRLQLCLFEEAKANISHKEVFYFT